MTAPQDDINDELSNIQDSEPIFEEWAAESTSDGKQIVMDDMIEDDSSNKQQSYRRKRKTAVTCEVCGLDLKWPSRIKEHMRTHTGEKPYVCDQCGKRFSQNTPFMNHYRAQHLNDYPFVCGFGCGKKFVSNARRNAHELKHRGEKRRGPPRPHLKPAKKLICPVMDAVPMIDDGGLALSVANYIEPPSLSNGFQEPTNSLLYPSSSAPSTSASSRIPTSYIQQPSGEEEEEDVMAEEVVEEVIELEDGGDGAELSEKAQETSARIDDVIATVLGRVLAPVPVDPPMAPEVKQPPKRFYQSSRTSTLGQCSICGLYLKHPSKIAAHIRTHTGEKQFQCGECGLFVTTAASLKVHIARMHTGERPFACSICDQTFVTDPVRKEHELAAHSGVKRYKCIVKDCDAVFTRRAYMMRHRKNFHHHFFSPIFNEHEITAAEELDPVLEQGDKMHNDYIYEDGGQPMMMMTDLMDHGEEGFDEEEYVEQGGI